MSILDTFYILFKNNATDYKKGAKEIEKSNDDIDKSSKKAGDQIDKTGKSFVKMVESATQAVTAVLSFGAIKAGVMNAQQLNSSLEVQSRLMGQNVSSMRAYAAATEAAGGSQQGFLGTFQGFFQDLAGRGIPLPPIDVLMRRIHNQAQLFPSKEGKELFFQRLGISDPGLKSVLSQNNAGFEKTIATAREHAAVTEKDTEAARAFGKQWSEATQALDTLFGKLGTEIFPTLNMGLKRFTDFLNSIKDNTSAMNTFFAVTASGALIAASAVGKLAGALVGAAGGGGGLLGKLGVLGLLGSAPELGSAGGNAIAEWIKGGGGGSAGRWLTGFSQRVMGGSQPTRAQAGNNEKESYDFWISQGYSPAQAAALVANERRESGGDPNARGDDGLAFGSFQWHQARRSKIYAGTGIDVASASHADQLKAAAWELNNMGLSGKLKGINDPGAAAAFISGSYERPANGAHEAAIRASMAPGIMQSYGGSNTSVKIDEVNIHTQATDANGMAFHASEALKTHIRNAVSNYDDAMER